MIKRASSKQNVIHFKGGFVTLFYLVGVFMLESFLFAYNLAEYREINNISVINTPWGKLEVYQDNSFSFDLPNEKLQITALYIWERDLAFPKYAPAWLAYYYKARRN